MNVMLQIDVITTKIKNFDKVKILSILLGFSIILFVTVSLLALYKTQIKAKQVVATNKTQANTSTDLSSQTNQVEEGQIAEQLPEHICPEAYDGQYFIYKGKRVGVDTTQGEWIHKNCPDIPGQSFSQHGKEYFVKEAEIDGPQPNGTVFNDLVFQSLAVSSANPDVVYIGTEGNGAFKSTDGGKNWTWLRKGFLIGESCDATQMTYGKIYDIAIDPSNENNVYAAVTCGPEVPDKSVGGLYKSTDAGITWKQKISGLPNVGVNSLAIDPDNPKIIYIGTNGEKPTPERSNGKPTIVPGGIFKSTDGGESWQTLSIPEKGKQNRFDTLTVRNGVIFTSGLKFTDQNNSRLPDRTNSLGLIKSTDGGSTWQIINPNNAFIESFDVTNDGQTIYAAQDENIGFKSIDGGKTWQQITINKPVKINHQNETVIFTGSLNKSDNKLVSSTKVLTTSGNAWVSDVEIAKSNNNIVYAATPGYVVYKSTDGGKSFTKLVNLRDWINKQLNTTTIKRFSGTD